MIFQKFYLKHWLLSYYHTADMGKMWYIKRIMIYFLPTLIVKGMKASAANIPRIYLTRDLCMMQKCKIR